ncbi:MAG: 50S ribosomal protein L7/L12 [Eubacteriales bacterium]|jgi:large subunit ribosomal protein L7/L12
MSNVNEIVEAVKGLTVLELAELVKKFEEEFGVSAAAPVAMAVPAAGAGSAQPAVEEEEQTEFDVILSSVGDKKINVIKVVREITGLGLKEAKELVDNVPKPVKEKIGKEEAQSIKEKLEEQGAGVDVK